MTGKEIMDRIANNIAELYGAKSLGWKILDDGNVKFIREEDGEEYESILSPEELQQFNY